MKLITESDFRDFDIIKEDANDKHAPSVKLRGIYIQCDKPNGNNRTYSFKMMKPEVDAFRKDFVDAGRALGQLEHPDYCEINPAEAAVRILSLDENEKEKNWIGESIVLASYPERGIKGTPKGDLACALINYGTKLGFSTRGVGEVNESTNEVTDFHLCTIDLVSNPSIGEFCDSNGNRCVNGILESKEFMINTHGIIIEKAYDKIEKKLSKMPNTFIKSKKDAVIAEAVHEFFKNLNF